MVTKKEAQEVLEELERWYNFSGFSAELRKDSNGWSHGSEEEAWFIFWEEGPYDWTMLFWEHARDKFPELVLETVCGWGLLGIYPWRSQ